MSSRDVQAIRQRKTAISLPALPWRAPVSPNIDLSIGFAAPISPHVVPALSRDDGESAPYSAASPIIPPCVIPHSAISLLPFADAANPGDGSAAAGLVAGGFHAPVGGPQPCQRMQRRRQRDFLAHG